MQDAQVLNTGVTGILWSETGIVHHFRLWQREQQMFLLQCLARVRKDVSYEVVKTVRGLVIHFSKADHIEPGNAFEGKLMPTFSPHRFAEGSL